MFGMTLFENMSCMTGHSDNTHMEKGDVASPLKLWLHGPPLLSPLHPNFSSFSGDRDCLSYLFSKDIVGVVIKMMKDFPSHAGVQQAGCEALFQCNEQPELRGILEDRQAHK